MPRLAAELRSVRKMMRRHARLVGAAIVLACGFAAGGPPEQGQIGREKAARLMEDLMFGRVKVGGPLALIDHTGRQRADHEWRGSLLLVYFGYTFCPDVCPTDLLTMAKAIDALGDLGARVQPIFITIDPERDTVTHLAGYVPNFHPRLIGLTGSPADVRAAADGYRVHYARVEDRRFNDYQIDHSAFIYLMNGEGVFLGAFPPGTTAARLASAMRPHAEQLRPAAMLQGP